MNEMRWKPISILIQKIKYYASEICIWKVIRVNSTIFIGFPQQINLKVRSNSCYYQFIFIILLINGIRTHFITTIRKRWQRNFFPWKKNKILSRLLVIFKLTELKVIHLYACDAMATHYSQEYTVICLYRTNKCR